ncbi:MAG: GNAT family N-acetyltransferase [Cytophagales bacterium]|nr:GNAT family N-acetyltransferase [Cytophagales bacterium]
MEFETLTSADAATYLQKKEIADFLHQHLDQYGDRHEDIMHCLDYALGHYAHQGGFVILARSQGQIKGTAVMNQTGMSGYIPENILVYLAVHADQRGMGLGKQLMQKAIQLAKGDVALHVEPDNPARHLYEKMGFSSKYLEMRLKKS